MSALIALDGKHNPERVMSVFVRHGREAFAQSARPREQVYDWYWQFHPDTGACFAEITASQVSKQPPKRHLPGRSRGETTVPATC